MRILIFTIIIILNIGFISVKDDYKTEYFIGNKKISEREFISNGKNGTVKIYSPDGKLCVVSGLKNGRLHGKNIEYHQSNGKIAVISNYKDGKKHGDMTRWYENGELEAKGNFSFENGNYNYWINEWYPNGNLSKKVVVTDGIGKAVEYYKCGKKFMEYELKGEIEHGKWKMWYKNGKIHIEGEYFNGFMDGQWIEYYDNGVKKSYESFNKGIADGKWITWDKKGKIKSVKKWENGVLLEEKDQL